jgi:D-3-phosphoglycerate dehydrogenase
MRTSYPKNRIRAVLLEGIHPAGAEALRAEGFQVETHPRSVDGAKLRDLVRGAHLVGIRSKTRLGAEVLAEADRLLCVGCFCIGTDQVDLAAAEARGVPVFNSPFSNTRSVAELTIAEVVWLLRGVGEKNRLMHAGVWDKSATGAHEVRGRTLGIVGYGHIGSQVSVLGEALGMRVVYYDIAPRLPLGNARPMKSLNDVLREADVLTLHVPETDRTRRMIGAPQLRRMKPGAVLINNARGSVVVVEALAEAIRTGHLGGAAVDVFPGEPSGQGEPFESPLRGLANVILTPHIGGSTEEAQRAIAEDVAAKMIRFVNVGSTRGAVNVPEVDLPEQEEGDHAARGRCHRILHFHRNVPGVLGAVHAAAAEIGANISASYLRTNERLGYVVLEVDPSDGERLLAQVRRIPETIRARMLW